MQKILVGVMALAALVAGVYFIARSPSDEPLVSATTGDIEMPVYILRSQQPAGASILVIVPPTGEQVKIQVPPNTREGAKVRVNGKGAKSSSGQRGDLYLNVRVQ